MVGFTIPDSYRVNVRLTEYAERVINKDKDVFRISRNELFLRVIANFKDKANASVYSNDKVKVFFAKEIYLAAFEDLKHYEITPKDKDKMIEKIWERLPYLRGEYTNPYKEEEQSPKAFVIMLNDKEDENKPYRCGKSLIEFLKHSREAQMYSLSEYFQALIEEYARLPFLQREQFIKSGVYSMIGYAKDNRKFLKITIKTTKEETVYYSFPYEITHDETNLQDYLACITPQNQEKFLEAINCKKTDQFLKSCAYKTVPVNLSRLPEKDVEICERIVLPASNDLPQSYFLAEETAKKRILRLAPQYIGQESSQFYVRLSEKGETILNNKFASRPKCTKQKDGRYLVKECTQEQAYHYFTTFGNTLSVDDDCPPKGKPIPSTNTVRGYFTAQLLASLSRYYSTNVPVHITFLTESELPIPQEARCKLELIRKIPPRKDGEKEKTLYKVSGDRLSEVLDLILPLGDLIDIKDTNL